MLHYFRFWRELRLLFENSKFDATQSGCTISVSEGNYDLFFFSFRLDFFNFDGCTISVSEGNYDQARFFQLWCSARNVALFPFLKGITTAAQSKLYIRRRPQVALFPFLKGITTHTPFAQARRRKLVALFPFLKGITTGVENYAKAWGFLLHYFRFWRELRPPSTMSATLSVFHKCCTISVSEGNYDLLLILQLYPPPNLVALFPFLKGITTFRDFKLSFKSLNGCTISVSEGNYDVE